MDAPLDIDKIIRIHLVSHPTPGEAKILQRWLNESEEHARLYHALQQVWRERSVEPVLTTTDQLAKTIWQRAQRDTSLRRAQWGWRWRWAGVAAAVLLVVASGVAIYQTQFAPGEVVVATSPPDRVIKRTLAGQRSDFALPDGSHVWLNAESSLQYRVSDFDSVRRMVLTGEGYFTVAKDPNRPFVVVSSMLKTVALGTEFNVQAYDTQTTSRVALVEGSVRVEAANASESVLEPGTAMAYDQVSKETEKYDIEMDEVIGWKNGVLVFNEDSFREFADKTARWYGVTVEATNRTPDDWSLSGYYEDVSLSDLLDDVSFSRDFSYQLRGDTISLIF